MNKHVKALIYVIGFLVLAGGVVVGSYKEFCTVREHKEDVAAIKTEIAGVSLFQQQITTQQQIKWLENDLRELYRAYGNPPYRNSMIQAKYEELLRQLEDERKALNNIRSKITK